MPCSPPGDLPNPGIELWSPTLEADSLPSQPPQVTGGIALPEGVFIEKGVEAAVSLGTTVKHLVIGLGPPSVGRSGVRKTREIWTSLYVSMSVCHCVSLPSLVESNGPCFTSDY